MLFCALLFQRNSQTVFKTLLDLGDSPHVSCDFFFQVDLLYMQSLRGIRDIHESGVDELSFSEVSRINQNKTLARSCIHNSKEYS